MPEGPAVFDWNQALELAGFDPESVETSDPQLPVPPYCDKVSAWRAQRDDGDRWVIQAGAFRGRPVYFEVVPISSIDAPERAAPKPPMGAFGGFLWLAMWVLAVTLAWRNIRLGRGDRKAAFRFAVVLAFTYLLIESINLLIRGHLGFNQLQDILWDRAGGHIVLHAAHVWFMYLAIEPYARRIWPRMLIGWVRFLSGRFRDPAIGREALIGLTCGVTAIAMGSKGAVFAAQQLGTEVTPSLLSNWELWILGGWGNEVIGLLYSITSPMLAIMYMTVILVGIRLVFRRDALAAVAGAMFFGLINFFGISEYVASPWFAAVISISVGVMTVVVYTRVGLLAAFFGLLASNLAFTPISVDLQTWYAGRSIFTLILLIGTAAWAGWVALAGRPLFKDLLDET